jgi:tRNA dimethylallyltransferase
MNTKMLIIVAGPTAVGKTDMAVRLARHFSTEIINADSRQVYREMTIGTAVPTPEQQAGIRHHFIGNKSVFDYYNASLYETEALTMLNSLFKEYDVVVMAGGSGMYIDAVCRGIDEIPTVDPGVRERIRVEFMADGLEGLRQKLLVCDPVYYNRVDLNNPQRIRKALEIYETTGRPYSSYLTGEIKKRSFSIIKIGLDMPREELHGRINQRVDAMMDRGLLNEARKLYANRHVNALNSVGYKELFSYIDNACTLEEAVRQIKGHSRQYARRQLTWFRKDPSFQWFRPDEPEAILNYVRQKMDEQ